jgi:hypothetical protein
VSGLVVILGSSRGDGNTARAVRLALPDAQTCDLSGQSVAPYDYGGVYPDGDRFIAIAESMTRAADIVLATPVYWYTMSGQMKLFLDRWSDLITTRKDMGRALAGRRLWLLATSPEAEWPAGFEAPFRLTAEYMHMRYAGGVHAQCRGDLGFDGAAEEALCAFGRRVRTAH